MKKGACIGFRMDDAVKAYRHMDVEVVEEYGDKSGLHWLHTWDDGGRKLLRCRNCGGYILCQVSELKGIEFDDYYADFFPVSGPAEARNLNEEYDGYAIEAEFLGRWLICDPCRVPRWSDNMKNNSGDME